MNRDGEVVDQDLEWLADAILCVDPDWQLCVEELESHLAPMWHDRIPVALDLLGRVATDAEGGYR